MSEPHLEDLPEAIPLHRVAPVWRTLAVAAFILAGLTFGLVIVLGIVIAGLRAQVRMVALTAGPAPVPAAWAPAAATPVPTADPDEPADAVNLPYPVRDDLRTGRMKGREKDETPSARERFLKKGTEVWKYPGGPNVSQVAVSPDGQQIAYFQGENLVVGPFANPQIIGKEPEEPVGGWPRPAEKTAVVSRDRRLVGVPAWSLNGRYVLYADAGGRLFRYDSQGAQVQSLALLGQSPAPIPGDENRFVLVRSHAVAKVETPGVAARSDPAEIVIGEAKPGKARVVVPAQGTASWHSLAVSPDGKRLAAVSDRGLEGAGPCRWRLFVGNLADGKMEPLTPPAAQVSRPCWTTDGKRVIYARSQEPVPADCRENGGGMARSTDLFEYDLEAKQETRLSRGGGFVSPGLGSDGSLFYLTWQADNTLRIRPRLRQMTLAGAEQFGRKEPTPPPRDLAVWAALLDQVCRDASIPANIDGALNPELMTRIDEQFARAYKEHFREDPPGTEAALDRLVRQELPGLAWTPEQRGRLTLVLGAVQGEFLRRTGGAEWQLVKGPLTGADAGGADDSNAFGYVFNPFLVPVRREAIDTEEANGREPSLHSLRLLTDGRPVLLSNDPAAARSQLAKRVSPELAQTGELFKQEKPEEAEVILIELANQDANRNNVYLALLAGRMLYDHGRLDALRKLLAKRCARPPYNARQFNLFGLALLDASPEQAKAEFKKALRCDLQFGPAYLNLAQAYENAGDTNSARRCLKRYLALMPNGPLAADAIRRLGVLDGPPVRENVE